MLETIKAVINVSEELQIAAVTLLPVVRNNTRDYNANLNKS